MKLPNQTKRRLIPIVCSTFALGASLSQAQMTVNISETETGALIQIRGELDLNGLGERRQYLVGAYGAALLVDAEDAFVFGNIPSAASWSYVATGPSVNNVFGSSTYRDLSPQGDDLLGTWGIVDSGAFSSRSTVVIPQLYDGGKIDISTTITGDIFTSQGGALVDNQFRTFTFANNETFTFRTGPALAVPEPSSTLLVGISLLVGFFRFRR